MIIKKILNNNVIITESESGREIVAMGRGIAFNKRCGAQVPDADIQRIYTLSNKNLMEKFQELLASMSTDYLQVSSEIIDFAEKILNAKLNESVYLSLTDHIHMAIHRIRNGIVVRNMMLIELQKFYEQEYFIGQKAVEIMNARFNVQMPEDEIGFIAFHIIDAQMDTAQPIATKMTQFIQEAINIVRMTLKIELDKDSLQYYRFITHLKFFAKRVFTGQESVKELDNDMYGMVKKKYGAASVCAEKISALVESKYHYKVSSDEKFYLTIHIAKAS